MDAAAALITRYGYDKTTVDEIAHEAGVSKGAIYLHFKGKEALFDALLLRESEHMVADLLARLDADAQGSTVFNLYRYTLVSLAENPLLKAVYTLDRRLLGDYMRRLRDQPLLQTGFSFTVDFVKRYQALGIFRADLEPEQIVYVLAIIRQGFLTFDELLPGMPYPPLDVLGTTLGLVLQDGLGGNADSEAGRAATAEFQRLLQWGWEALKQLRTKGENTA